jgi:RNA pol II promoter Fmp27 protein domain/Domain of unknown function (DUF2405)
MAETYRVSVHNVYLGAKRSSPQNPLHREWLGHGTNDDDLTANAYLLRFSLEALTLDKDNRKIGHDLLRLLTVEPCNFQALISQWSSRWWMPTPFLPGDPNSPLLALQVKLGNVLVTERLDSLERLFSLAATHKQSTSHPSPLSAKSFTVPRVSLDVDCGMICLRISHADSRHDQSFAMELRTDGFMISAFTQFLPKTSWLHDGVTMTFAEGLPLQMDITSTMILKPTFVRICCDPTMSKESRRTSMFRSSKSSFTDDPALLSLETVEIKGEGQVLGHIDDDSDNMAMLDPSSIFFTFSCSSEALAVELWDATVVNATARLVSSLHKRSPVSTLPPSGTRLLDRLPYGLSATVALSRIVVFVTAPDLNPNDDMEISRGLAFRTGISLQYCALQLKHIQLCRNITMQTQARHKLYLAEDQIAVAMPAAKVSAVTQRSSAFFRISVWNLAMRSALSTQYATDEPHIAERDDPAFSAKDFLQMRNGTVDINMSGKRGAAVTKDICQATIRIPYLRGAFHLAQIYSLLLASQTLMLFSQNRSPPPQVPMSSSGISYHFQATIKTIQILWTLPNQRLFSRIDSAIAYTSPQGQPGVRWSKFVICVLPPPASHIKGREENRTERWAEIARMQHFDITFAQSGSLSVSVQGDNARFCVPFGYVVADLIHELGVTIKCIRHLRHMVPASRYFGMPPPEAEAAKFISNLTCKIRCLSFEAADDPLESRLNLIWRAGVEACKHRTEREAAFLLKVATIMAAESSRGSPSPPGNPLDPNYQFNANHSVSVEDARQRLQEVHAVDWILKHRLDSERRTQREESILHALQGGHKTRVSTKIPNLIDVAPLDLTPPLFRAMLHNLSLNASPPSFPLNRLHDFIAERGIGLPLDTQFSLLLLMHLHFTLSSLRVTIRDYPLPLLDIPQNEHNILAWELDTDLVIAEEMGTALSVDWVHCDIVEPHDTFRAPLSILVPKTIMPVKTYANPVIRVATKATTFAWGISYGPATQDLLRIADTLSSSPRDLSPPLGFWDKVCFLPSIDGSHN